MKLSKSPYCFVCLNLSTSLRTSCKYLFIASSSSVLLFSFNCESSYNLVSFMKLSNIETYDSTVAWLVEYVISAMLS
jgi:hypothetical protein